MPLYTNDDYILLEKKSISNVNGYSKIELASDRITKKNAYSNFQLEIKVQTYDVNHGNIIFSLQLNDCFQTNDYEIKPNVSTDYLINKGEGIIISQGIQNFTLIMNNLPPNEEFEIVLKVGKDISDMVQQTKGALLEATSEDIFNPLCFTISDYLLNFIGEINFSRFLIPKIMNNMYVEITFPKTQALKWLDKPRKILFEINELGEINVSLNTKISFYLSETSKDPFASKEAIFILKTSPHITYGTNEFLEFDFKGLELKDNEPYNIYLMDELTQIFEDEIKFKVFIDNMLKEISSGDSGNTFGDTFRLVLNRLPVPSNWGKMGNAKAHFERFYFKTGHINGQKAGYLIAMFSIVSLTDCSTIIGKDENKKINSSLFENADCNKQLLYNRMGIGISQNAINEIFKPFHSVMMSNGFDGGGDLHWDVSYWVKSGIKNVKITNSGFNIDIPVIEGGGNVVAKYKTRGITWWRASAGIKLAFDDVDTSISISVSDDGKAIKLGALIDIGDFEVTIEIHNSYLFDIELDVKARFSADAIVSMINTALAIILFDEWTSIPDSYVAIRELNTNWYENESLILELGLIID